MKISITLDCRGGDRVATRPPPLVAYFVGVDSVQLTGRLHPLHGGNTSPLLKAISSWCGSFPR